jgi:hypothetical protein
MKRFVVSLAVLLAFYGLARADYVIIIYNLTTSSQGGGGNPGGNQGGAAGMMGGPGMGGMPGGAVGGRGAIGAGGAAGAAGAGGFVPPGGGGIGGGAAGAAGAAGAVGAAGAAGAGGFGPPGGAMGGALGAGGGAAGAAGAAGAGGAAGARGAAGAAGAAGAGGFGPPGAMGGGVAPGGASGSPPGGASGGGRGMSGSPPGGAGGMSGSPPGGGSWQPPGGFGGGYGGAAGAGGGMAGMGGMGMGGMGMGGMGMGGMGMGGMGMGGMGMGGWMAGGGGPDPNATPLLAIAVVEVERWSKYGNTGVIHASHKFSPKGSYILPVTSDKRITAAFLQRPSIHARFKSESDLAHSKKPPDVNALVNLAAWALKHDLLDEFVKVMDEVAVADPQNEAVVAFKKVQDLIKKDITKPDLSDTWRAKVLDGYKVEKSEHYALLHNLEANKPAEAMSRLNRLEANYRAFYYWFALQGKVMPVPDQRLVAVLVKRGDEFKRQQQIFDSLPSVSDGFLARRENLAVFSLERTDLASAALERSTKSLWAKLVTDRDTSLKQWPRDLDRVPLQLAAGAEMQTIALLERALQEDAEIAAVTHEGTRQLLAATGELPRNVAVPEWLQFGWASFFETPKGAPWMTVGAPSATLVPEFNYFGQFKAADKAGKIKDRTKALVSIVTDNDFRVFARNPKSEEARVKARTMAWSLTFFLANARLDGLRRYHEELKKLPRDLEFDERTLLLAFARAFDCVDGPNAINHDKLDKLAQHWRDYIDSTRGDDEDLLGELAKKQTELKTQQAPKGGEAPPGR